MVQKVGESLHFLKISLLLKVGAGFLLFFLFLMRNHGEGGFGEYPFKPLTPQDVDEYLKKRPEYKKIWDKVVRYFKPETVCKIVNELRLKRINQIKELTSSGQELVVFNLLKEAIDNTFLVAIPPSIITKEELYQLLGFLMNVVNLKKKKEFNGKLFGVLVSGEISDKERYEEHQKYQEYAEEVLAIARELAREYFCEKEIALSLRGDEIMNFIRQAFQFFCSFHKDKIDCGLLDPNILRLYVRQYLPT